MLTAEVGNELQDYRQAKTSTKRAEKYNKLIAMMESPPPSISAHCQSLFPVRL
jgi:hypothetical protein